MIICDHIGKVYGRRYALQDFSFTFAPGHIYAVLGPNGSGKSTLMKMIAGLVKPSEGQISMGDHPLNWKDKQTIAYMPTEPYFYNYMTGLQVAKYYQDFFTDFNMERFQWFMQVLQLDPEMKVREFSTGMLAKFKVAVNISRNPAVLMLDEPLNGIDMIARDEVLTAIMQGFNPNTAVLISSHLIEDLEKIADHVLFIREGKLIVSGSAEEFRSKYGKSMTDMYREIFGNALLYGQGMFPGMQQGMQPGMQQGMQSGMQQGMQQNAQYYGNMQGYGNAQYYGNMQGYGNAQNYENAQAYDNTQYYGNAQVAGNAQPGGNPQANMNMQGGMQTYVNAQVQGSAQAYEEIQGNVQVHGNDPVNENIQADQNELQQDRMIGDTGVGGGDQNAEDHEV